MFSSWNNFDELTSESISDLPFFRAQDNLWLKLAENLTAEATGTSAFLNDTIEHLLESAESKSLDLSQSQREFTNQIK
ncbi:hypothetical protein Xen7305DRAFT_00024030 [Xenococcus sp. PCC 7305]|uniref:hypothetical protein n=1 Tax=Xenococcus sp. PCC 7305 TaxID=102125 RepID=UPI0002ABD188|nr:hypothetical protein [Xenococcus sp. PCC 7305]ELS02685.1 hypothetical protein Xen7305DRAFT_00024030 [Xenococcus sp. PCC 7305]